MEKRKDQPSQRSKGEASGGREVVERMKVAFDRAGLYHGDLDTAVSTLSRRHLILPALAGTPGTL